MSYRRELWERSCPPMIRGGDVRRCRRMTKSRLVAIANRKEVNNLPKIETEVREGADDVQIGVSYEIINVEEITTDVKNYVGYRVSLMSPQHDEGSVMLWKRKITGSTSKLGVFISALGDNTDKWINRWIVFRQWLPLKREIEVLEASAAKKSSPAKKK